MLSLLLTGPMGAGKSSASSFLSARGYPVFRADTQARELLKPSSPCYEALKSLFVEDCFSSEKGEFDRKKLAREIFRNPEKRKAMEAIIHPEVRKSFQAFVKKQEKQGKNRVFYEAPLLSRGIFQACDKSILITCPEDIRKKRLMERAWDREDVERRLAVQIPESEVREKADFIVDNSRDLKNLQKQLERILALLDGSGK